MTCDGYKQKAAPLDRPQISMAGEGIAEKQDAREVFSASDDV
jgi:hypothetical protein